MPIQYIGFAYHLSESELASLAAHVPDWVIVERFDITASVEGTPNEDQLRTMMQSLLEDRFKLEASKQDREIPVLALILAKTGTTGPRLKPHLPDPPCPEESPLAESQESVPAGFPLACHGIVALPSSIPGGLRLGARDVTLEFITDALSGLAEANLGRPIVDKTGLIGKYDFALECTPERAGSAPLGELSSANAIGPSFREALQDQLGLKLQAEKDTRRVFIIDHIEHPSEN